MKYNYYLRFTLSFHPLLLTSNSFVSFFSPTFNTTVIVYLLTHLTVTNLLSTLDTSYEFCLSPTSYLLPHYHCKVNLRSFIHLVFLLSSILVLKISSNRKIYLADYSTIFIQMEYYADKKG